MDCATLLYCHIKAFEFFGDILTKYFTTIWRQLGITTAKTGAGGFYILQNLCTKTNKNFEPYKMGIEELEKYSSFANPLEENDLKKQKH